MTVALMQPLNSDSSKFRSNHTSTRKTRRLGLQLLESRQLLAGDVATPLADITGLWIDVNGREYFTSEQAAVTIDMTAGETLRVTGVRYGLSEVVTPDHGVVAFESYVRREHGAAATGSFDYTDGRFADPVEAPLAGGEIVVHPGFESGWQLDVIDNRVTVVAIRYFGNEFVVEDRMLVDINVMPEPEDPGWTHAVRPVEGDWAPDDPDAVGGDSRAKAGTAGLSVIETATAPGDRFEIGVKAKTVEESTWANGFVVVDYQDENDFVYAGLRAIADKWVIGHFDGDYNDLVAIDQPIESQQFYDLRVAVDGSHLALAADGVFRISYDFERPLGVGAVGLANEYALTHFKEFQLFQNGTAGEVLAGAETVDVAGLESALAEARELADRARAASDEASQAAEQAAQDAELAQTSLDEAKQLHLQAEQTSKQAVDAYQQAQQAATDAEQTHRSAYDELQQAARTAQEASKQAAAADRALQLRERAAKSVRYRYAETQSRLQESEDRHSQSVQSLADAVSHHDTAVANHEEAHRAYEEAQARLDDELSKKERKAAERAAADAERAAEKAAKSVADAQESVENAKRNVAESGEVLNQHRAYTERFTILIEQYERTFADTQRQAEETQAVAVQAEQRANDARQNYEQSRRDLELQSERVAEARDEQLVAKNALESAANRLQEAGSLAGSASQHAHEARDHAARLAHEAALAERAASEAQVALDDAQQPQGPRVDGLTPTEPTADEIAYALNFNHQDAGSFETAAGHTELVAGQFHLVPTVGEEAVAVMDNESLPERTATRAYATVRMDAFDRYDQNGFIVFDYESPENFKYAGVWGDADRWAIGEVVDGEWLDRATEADETISAGPAYELQIRLTGDSATLIVGGVWMLQYEFESDLNDGQLGIATNSARSRFDQIAVLRLHETVGEETNEATDAALEELF